MPVFRSETKGHVSEFNSLPRLFSQPIWTISRNTIDIHLPFPTLSPKHCWATVPTISTCQWMVSYDGSQSLPGAFSPCIHLEETYLLNCWWVRTNPSKRMGNLTSQLPTIFCILKSRNFAGNPSFCTTRAYFLAASRDCSSLQIYNKH